jgi:thiol-disulfide isomerase/thioredoxin
MSVIEVKEAGAKHLTEQEYSVIYVYADNCNPCNQYAPKFLNVSEKLPSIKFGKFKLPKDEPSEFKRTWLKVDTGKPPYGTPTTLVFKSGELFGIQQGAILDEAKLEYFILNGKLPSREVNPLIAGLSAEVRAALLEKESIIEQMNIVRTTIENINKIVAEGKATEDDRVERMFLTEKLDVLNVDLQVKSQQIKELLIETKPEI